MKYKRGTFVRLVNGGPPTCRVRRRWERNRDFDALRGVVLEVNPDDDRYALIRWATETEPEWIYEPCLQI